MKFDKHGNGKGLDDLYILPETVAESQKIQKYLEDNNIFGKTFFLAVFAESHKDAIARL